MSSSTYFIEPPPPPRDVPARYAPANFFTSGQAILGLVLTILGVLFSGLGIVFLVLFGLIDGNFIIGLTFLIIGLILLPIGAPILWRRYQAAQNAREIFERGEAVLGTITDIYQDLQTRINRRHPWRIKYRFTVEGKTYEGESVTVNAASVRLRPHQSVYLLYLPEEPQRSDIYFIE